MSNICNTCSNLVNLTKLICGSDTCFYNYRFNLWFDETNNAGFLIYNSIIPDIFRKCFSEAIIDDIKNCKNICPYYYEKNNPTNLTLGYQKRIMNLLSQNDIKALLYFGYSTPSFNYVKKINGNKVELTNNEILLFNQMLESNNRNILNKKSARDYISNHQITFFNYFSILYPVNTLIYQLVNFIFKAKKTYSYVLSNKIYLNTVRINWEYTLSCNSDLKNNKNIEINEKFMAYLYVLYERYLANNFVIYEYYQKFFDIIRYSLDVYNDIYLIYKKQRNYLRMPLFNKMNTFKICKRQYMSDKYKIKCRRYYNNYITNKSNIYTNKVLNINIDRDMNFESILANIIPIKVNFPKNTYDKINFFKENYPLLEFNFEEDNSFPKIEKYYFLNRMDNLNIDLSKFTNIICWNYFNDIILDVNDILKNFNYSKNVHIQVEDNICVYVFYYE